MRKMMNGLMPLPPKMAEQLAERAKTLDGCVRLNELSDIYEFPQGSNVAVLMSIEHPSGHVGKDAVRANELRRIISERATP
jgi:hypothetical protein